MQVLSIGFISIERLIQFNRVNNVKCSNGPIITFVSHVYE